MYTGSDRGHLDSPIYNLDYWRQLTNGLVFEILKLSCRMGLSLIFFEIMNSAPKQKPAKRQAKSTKSFKPSRRFIKRIGIALAIIVAVFGVWELGRLGGLWGDPNMLLRVKAEKISNKDLLGMELVDRKVSGYNDPLSKKVTPSIENRFKPVDGDVEKTIAKIIEFAENDG